MAEYTNTDIEFDRYGDMSFVGNDLSFVFTDIDYLYQNVIDRLISNFGDYLLYEDYGANMSSYIGSNTNTELEAKIVDSIRRSLTKDNFIKTELIDIVTMLDHNSILIKIQIGGDLFGVTDIMIINSIFNTSSGLLYVTN